MNMTPPPDKAVAPILTQNIEYYGKFVDIVERPNVGALTVPEDVAKLVDETLNDSLHYCNLNRAETVRVRCVKSKRGELKLEVTAEYMHSTLDSLWRLMSLNPWARRLGGEFVYGGDVRSDGTASNYFMRLLVPIPP